MDYKTEQEFLNRLLTYIDTKLNNETAQLMRAFATQYYHGMIIENFESHHSIEDWYGALLSHWNLLLKHDPKTFCVQVYNPTLEEHSWQSQHTIVEIIIADRPFLLQSVCMEINRSGFTNHLVIHPVFNFKRDEKGLFVGIENPKDKGKTTECLLHVEIDRQTNQSVMTELEHSLNRILNDVQAVTKDWKKCLEQMKIVISELKSQQQVFKYSREDSINFLQWLHDDHFVFLGYREYALIEKEDQHELAIIPATGRGILQDSIDPVLSDHTTLLSKEIYDYFIQTNPLIITKATTRSTVHRSVFMDYIGVKQYSPEG